MLRFFVPRPVPRFLALPTLISILYMAGGCGGAGLLRSYNDPSAEGHRLDPIVVLAFHPNPEVQKQFEKVFADYLRERGNEVMEAHTLGSAEMEPTRKALQGLVKEHGIAGVFTVRVLAQDPNQEGDPDKTAYDPKTDGDLYQYYFETRRDMLPDQAVAKDGIIYLEGRLYATSNAQVVWGGLTASQNDNNLDELTDQYAAAAVFAMAAKGYVK
jgi:hypothetical protein